MLELLQRLLDLARTGLDRQPALVLALAAAFAAIFLSTILRRNSGDAGGIAGQVYRQLSRVAWGVMLVAMVAGAVVGIQAYLNRTLQDYRHSHGRLTEVNLQAVRTIWGDEQVQGDLSVSLWWEEEQTERIESEDLSKPTVTRKKTLRHPVASNPFMSTRHEITVRQNARKKGSGIYPGYETDCRFQWVLRNPAERDVQGTLRFPLPSSSAMFDDLSVTCNGTNALPRLQIENGALVLEQDFAKGETLDVRVAFKSRGLSYWYFQVREPREMRDFELKLVLPDLAKSKLNYPEGCMTPTEIATEGNGCALTYRLDRAICNKGMGVSMPKLTQPGETTSAVLAEAGRGWVLLFVALVLGTATSGGATSALRSVLMGIAAALAFGLMGDISDSFLGFWGSAIVVLVPAFCLLSALAGKLAGKLVAIEVIAFGLIYPCVAGFDASRQTLYLNVCAGLLLAVAVWSARGAWVKEFPE